MKKRTIIGGFIAVGAAVGIMLSSWWSNLNLGEFGLGSGNSISTSTGGKSKSATPVTATSSKTKPKADAKTKEVTSSEKKLAAAPLAADERVVNVLIDGRQYLVRRAVDGNFEYQPVSLEKIEKLTRAATGDDDGIRIRISRRGSARTTAEIALRDRLLAAGVNEESMRWQEVLVP